MVEFKSEMSYREIYDMGSGLVIAEVPINTLREQDVNARIMKPEMMRQLTENIKNRGQLESLPFCILKEKSIDIISGHHRIKAAREAGIEKIIIILDISGLSRSQVAAKQLAHNAISGFDDESTIREIVKMIEDVDDMLESFIGKDIMEEPLSKLEKINSPSIDFDFQNVCFSFLSKQVEDFDILVEEIEKTNPEIVGIADISQANTFIEALSKYQKFTDIKNVGAAIHAMVTATCEKMEIEGFDGQDDEWTYLSKIFGSNAIPRESAEIIKEAVKKAQKEEIVGSKNKWQLIEYLAADYLSGD
ncbi:ParB N-terminal domain-containing protein [Eubacterium sp.]|uniref:ParB N-terminal domain-containing protein n=1 Tax=Eubacterium sp. TaxID=142586 RepID=UPI002FC9994B